jgi:hypothetical protein
MPCSLYTFPPIVTEALVLRPARRLPSMRMLPEREISVVVSELWLEAYFVSLSAQTAVQKRLLCF